MLVRQVVLFSLVTRGRMFSRQCGLLESPIIGNGVSIRGVECDGSSLMPDRGLFELNSKTQLPLLVAIYLIQT